MKRINWEKAFDGKTQDEIAKIILESDISYVRKFYLRKTYIKGYTTEKYINWKNILPGKTDEEMYKLIEESGLSARSKLNLRKKYMSNPDKYSHHNKWNRMFEGKTFDEISEIISKLDVASGTKHMLC